MGHLLDSYGDLGAIVRGALSPSNYATLASCPNTLPSSLASPYPPPPVCDADSNMSSSFPGLYNPPCTLIELPSISSLNTELVDLPSVRFSSHHYKQLLPSQPAPAPSVHSSFSSSMSSSEPFDSTGSAMSCSIMAMESFQHQLQPSLPMRRFPLKVKEEMETVLHPCTNLLSDVSAMSGSHPHALQAFAETTKKTAKTELMSSSAMTMDHLNKGRAPRRRKLIQKRVVHIPAMGEISSRPNAGETVPTDMWAWRKYGQKPIKGSPYPRGYYRCSSSKGCPARKQVERNPNDPAMLVVTYTSEHNHVWQTHRINSLAGSTQPAQAEAPPPMVVSMSNTKLSPNAFNMSPVRFDNMDDDDDDASLLSHDDGVDNDLVQGLSHVLQGLERDHGEEASFLAVNSAFTPTSAPYPAGDNAAKPDTMTWSGLAARSSFMDIMAENNAGAYNITRTQCAHDVGHGTVMAAETTAREVSCVEDDSSNVFDVLLSEMLEEVQKQNRAKMEVMMMMEEGEEKGIAPFITWSNNMNFVSQVNHVFQ